MNPRFKEFFDYRSDAETDIYEWFTRVYPNSNYRTRSTMKWMNILEHLKPDMVRSYTRKVTTEKDIQRHIRFTPVPLETGEILMTCWDITRDMELGQRMHERNLVLEVLNDVLSSVSGSLHLSEIIDTLKTVFAQKLKVDAGGIFLTGEFTDGGNLQAQWGIDTAYSEAFKEFALGFGRRGKGIQESDVTITTEDVDDFDDKTWRFFKKRRWLRSLCMTLYSEGERQAVVFLLDRKKEAFNADQIAFFRTLGQQIGVAFQNAHLFEQVQKSHGDMKALSLKLVEVQEAERRYIARELHDEIGQELTGLKLMLEMNVLNTKRKKNGLGEAQAVVNRLMGLVREMSLNLRPAMLDDLGLLPTLLWHFSRFTAQTNIQVAFRHIGLEGKRFPLELETAIYRIVQEALTNVARHAHVIDVTVRIWSDDKTIGVQVEDSGIGFTVGSISDVGKTNGIAGMRERAILLGGHFAIDSAPGSGARLSAEMPINIRTAHEHH
jgi:signal transduction histidine kinase